MRSMVYETVERAIDSSNGHLSSFARPFNVGLAVLKSVRFASKLVSLARCCSKLPGRPIGNRAWENKTNFIGKYRRRRRREKKT